LKHSIRSYNLKIQNFYKLNNFFFYNIRYTLHNRGETESKVCGGLLLLLAGRIMKPHYLFCMIRKEELRIGNKVKCSISNDHGIYTVLGIPAWGFDGMGNGKEPLILIDRCPKELVPESKLRPIPLTPEILEAAGLIKSPTLDRWYKMEEGVAVLEIEYDSGWWWCIDDDGTNEGSRFREIKYVHQLQNIYFIVMEKELEINLTKQTT
jgi:hypothetical protein